MKYQFDNWSVCLQTQSLSFADKTVELEPRVFQLLLFFCKHPNQAVSRAQLVEAVWQGRIVSDAAVNRAISELRKVLDTSSDQKSYIKTVSKVGYQFIAEPTILTGGDDSKAKPAIDVPIGNVFAGIFLLFVLMVVFYIEKIQ